MLSTKFWKLWWFPCYAGPIKLQNVLSRAYERFRDSFETLKFQSDNASERSWFSLRYLLPRVIFGNVYLLTLNYLWNILKCRFFSSALQLTSGNVGLTEHVEGEPRHFMVWVGTSIANALVLHTFEVSSFMKFNSVEYKAIEGTSTETVQSRTLISGLNLSNLVFINLTPCSVW